MRTTNTETIVTPTSNDTSPSAILAAVFGLIIVAFVCYFLFFHRTKTVEHTIFQPVPSVPGAAAPAPNVNTTIELKPPAGVPTQPENPGVPKESPAESQSTNP